MYSQTYMPTLRMVELWNKQNKQATSDGTTQKNVEVMVYAHRHIQTSSKHPEVKHSTKNVVATAYNSRSFPFSVASPGHKSQICGSMM